MSQVLTAITGVPHSGKTTLIGELVRRGHLGMEEVARPIIEMHLKTGGPLPWTDIDDFTAKLWPLQVGQFRSAVASGRPTVFDRGLPDALAFLEVLGGARDAALVDAIARDRYTHVFLLKEVPRLGPDPVRPFSEAEQRAIERALLRVYGNAGYLVQVVPLLSVEERADLVVAAMSRDSLSRRPKA